MLSTVERPLPETGSGDPPPPPPAPADDNVEPATGDGQKLRNEAVAAFIDRDDWAGKTGDHAEPATGNGQILRNEAVAAFIDRADSAGQAVAYRRRFSRGSRPIARTLATLGGRCSLGRKRRAVSGGLNRGTRLVLDPRIAADLVRRSPLNDA